MATSVQHVFTSVSHTHMVTSCMKCNCKLKRKGNACNCPHYVIKIPQFECSSGIFQGIYLFYWGFSFYISITLVCEYHSLLSDLQPGSHHALTASLLAAQEANTGQMKQGVISAMWLSEEIYTSKATGCSEAFLFTLTPQRVL